MLCLKVLFIITVSYSFNSR